MLIAGEVLHCDETGCRVNGKLNWLQIFASGEFTLYSHNKKRGDLGFEGADLLSIYTGILVHDHLKSYYGYDAISHAECNDHIKRYLKTVEDILKHSWAATMAAFLSALNKRKKSLLACGAYFSREEIDAAFTEYANILDAGDSEYLAAIEGKTHIKHFNYEKCLLRRLREFTKEHLRFVTDAAVPFGNNCAEQSAKEAKRKQKVSGGYRSDSGTKHLARNLSVFVTLRKQKRSVFAEIKNAFNGSPPRFSAPVPAPT
jgi:transposase